MRVTGKTDVTGLFKYYKEHVDPEFIRFETSFRSRTLPELARLVSFFKAWNDNPAAGDGTVEELPEEIGSCEAQLQELESRLRAEHADEVNRLEAQIRESAISSEQALEALSRNTTNDRTIAGLLARMPWTGFDTPINDLRELLGTDTRAYCRVHGILFAGELWALKHAPAGVERDVVAICSSWNIARDADILAEGYVPRYWLNPAFYTTCALPVGEVLRPGEYSRKSRMETYIEPGQRVGDFLRKWRGVPGKLQDFQHCLDKSHGDAVHAGCYVPDEWGVE